MATDRGKPDTTGKPAAGRPDDSSEPLVWKNPPGANRTTPGSHSTGGRKDHALPGESESN